MENIIQLFQKYRELFHLGEYNIDSINILKKQIPALLYKVLKDPNYKIYGSTGFIGVAEIPWVALLDKRISTSTQRGFYVQYLFNHAKSSLFLCVSVGWLGFYEPEKNLQNAKSASLKVINYLNKFFATLDWKSGPVPLEAQGILAKGYEHNCVVYKEYDLAKNHSQKLIQNDLNKVLKHYKVACDAFVQSS